MNILWLAVFVFLSNCYFTAAQCSNSLFPVPNCPCAGTKCGVQESVCIEEYLKSVLYRVLSGRSCSGINRMDPLELGDIEGDFATFSYKNTKTNVTGLSKTRITFLKVSDDIKMAEIKLDIPGFVISSLTNFTGYILYKPSQGVGQSELDYGRTVMKIYVQLVNASTCCETYLQFGNFSLDGQVVCPMKFFVTPIYDDNSEVTAERNRFMDDNWQDMSYFVREPKFNPIVEKLLTYANDYLRTVPINDILNY